MRHYLATLHKKPHHHKRRFAFLASGGFTLMIFGIWALVNFGGSNAVVAENTNRNIEEASPFGSLSRGIAASFGALWGQVGELKNGLEVVNFESSFEKMRDNTLDTYGQ